MTFVSRSAHPFTVTALLLLLGYAAILFYPGETWWSSSVTVWDWTGVTIVVAGPLTAATVAWWAGTCRRIAGSGSWRRDRLDRWFLLQIAPIAAVVLLAHATAVVAAHLIAASHGHRPALAGSILLVGQVASLLMFAVVGAAAAATFSHVLTPPLVAVVTFLPPTLLFSYVPQDVWAIGGATGVPWGYEPSVGYLVAQVAWTGGLGVIAAAFVPAGIALRRPTFWLVLVVGVALAGLGSRELVRRSDTRFVPVGQVLNCAGSAPEICLPDLAEGTRPAIDEVSRKAFAALQELGVPAPGRLEAGGAEPSVGVRALSLPSTPRPTATDLAVSNDFMLSLVGVKACLDDGRIPPESGGAVLLAVRWLQAEVAPEAIGEDVDARSVRDAGDVGRAWLVETLSAYARCDPARIPTEVPGTR